MRTQVAQVVLHNEELVREYRQHIRVMQTATANCEQATNQKESSTAAQQVCFPGGNESTDVGGAPR